MNAPEVKLPAFTRKLAEMGAPVFATTLNSNGGPTRTGWQKTKPGMNGTWRPGMAVGMVTGKLFDVIDVDPRNGGELSFRRLSHELGEDGPEVYADISTPSGGRHLYIDPQGLGTHHPLRPDLPGLDLQGEGAFVFLPGTQRKGGIYRRGTPLSRLAELNGHGPCAALVEAYERGLNAGEDDEGSRQSIDAYKQRCLKAAPGGQRKALLAYVYELERRGYSRDDIVDLTKLLVKKMPQFDPRPWTSIAIRGLLHRDGAVSPDASPGEVDNVTPIRGREDAGNGDLLARMRNGGYLNTAKFRKMTWAVPQLLPEGTVILVGGPKIGKSLIIHRFALEVARGGEVFGQQCDHRHSLYLALEDGDRRIQQRSRELLGGEPIPDDFHYILEVEPGKLTPTVRAFLDKYPDGLVVVDTLGKAMERPQKGETTYDRDYRIAGSLKAQADAHPGSCLVVNHHSRKAGADDFVDMVSGTQGISGAMDTVLTLLRKRGSIEGTLKIAGRDVSDAEYALILEKPAGWSLDGEDLMESSSKVGMRNSALGDRSIEVIMFVNEHPDGVTAQQASVATGIELAQVRVYLGRAVDAGHIVRVKRGLYGPPGKLSLASR